MPERTRADKNCRSGVCDCEDCTHALTGAATARSTTVSLEGHESDTAARLRQIATTRS
eukprot:COSAG06_NODE_468_length_15337_cov_84.949075_6_plen_58_part_00